MVLITGATGNVGREVVRLILDEGGHVAAVSRNPAAASLPAKGPRDSGRSEPASKSRDRVQRDRGGSSESASSGRRGKGVRDAGGVERGPARRRLVRAHGAVWRRTSTIRGRIPGRRGRRETLGPRMDASAIRRLRVQHEGVGAADSSWGCATRRLIRDSKLFLEAHFSASVRLSDVAGAVSASPAYLTDVFRRVEGVSLHRYLIQLRLAKALIELPHTNDLTQLALRLGFSSHSHFTAAFRRAFGCTPSDFRASTRCATTSNGAVSASAMTKQ
jgi:AraC-like DNA-binding protein